MELEAVLRERFSVRKYQDIPVEEEKLDRILEAGRLALTGKKPAAEDLYLKKPGDFEKNPQYHKLRF